MKTLAMVLSWRKKARMLMFAPAFATVMSIGAYIIFNVNLVWGVLSAVTSLLYINEKKKYQRNTMKPWYGISEN